MKRDEVKQDLRDIKFYYNSNSLDDWDPCFLKEIKDKVVKYDTLIVSAPLFLRDLYYFLYHRCLRQSEYACYMGVSRAYVCKLVNNLYGYFQNRLP